VPAIPVISNVSVMAGPISAEAHKYVPSVMVWVYISNPVIWPVVITHRIIVSRPDDPVAQSLVAVTVNMNVFTVTHVLDMLPAILMTDI